MQAEAICQPFVAVITEMPMNAYLCISLHSATTQLRCVLRRYGKTAFDVTLLVLEDDGAVLTSSLAAASLALADAKALGSEWSI